MNSKSNIPAVAEHTLRDIESRISQSDIKQFSDTDLLILHSVYGVILQRALDILEKYSTLVAYTTADKLRVLLEINGDNDRVYRVFPRINFCPCKAFKHQVIEKKLQVTCKHILAARIASILGKTVPHEVTADQYLMLLKSSFDLEEQDG